MIAGLAIYLNVMRDVDLQLPAERLFIMVLFKFTVLAAFMVRISQTDLAVINASLVGFVQAIMSMFLWNAPQKVILSVNATMVFFGIRQPRNVYPVLLAV